MAEGKKMKAKKKKGEGAATILTETSFIAKDSSKRIKAQIDEYHEEDAEKLMVQEGPAIIKTEIIIVEKDNTKTMSKKEDVLNTKGDKTMAEETMWNQGAKWQEMMTGMWKNMPALNSSNKAMEPIMELTRMRQQGFMNMYQVWSDELGKIREASRSGDVKKVMETCVESNKEIFNTCQEVMKEQTTAQYELLRKFIPALPNFPGVRS